MSKAECAIERLVAIVEQLRSKDGCPWDRVQTTDSLKPYLLEECQEFLCAADTGDSGQIRDELGDLLLQIVLHARIFEEQGRFNLQDAAEAICNKLVRRHPHVFDRTAQTQDVDLELQWELIKAGEKSRSGGAAGLFEQIDTDLPPLLAAHKIAKRAARVGLDWPDAKAVIAKVREEVDELEEALADGDESKLRHETGDLLFAVANLARHVGVDADLALRQNLLRFVARVQYIERRIVESGRTFSDTNGIELDRLWEEAKFELERDKSA